MLTEDDNMSRGAISAAMQCAAGKKATELCIIQTKALAPLPFSVNLTSNVRSINKAINDNTRNLLIRSVCINILSKTLLLCSQEIKREHQEHIKAKEIRLGHLDVDAVTRQNPDTSYGLFCGAAIRAKAMAVDRARSQKKTTDESKKVVSQLKKFKQQSRKKEAYDRIVASINTTINNSNDTLQIILA